MVHTPASATWGSFPSSSGTEVTLREVRVSLGLLNQPTLLLYLPYPYSTTQLCRGCWPERQPTDCLDRCAGSGQAGILRILAESSAVSSVNRSLCWPVSFPLPPFPPILFPSLQPNSGAHGPLRPLACSTVRVTQPPPFPSLPCGCPSLPLQCPLGGSD